MANLISLLRVLLGFVVVAMLFHHTHGIYLTAFTLTIVVIWMDGLDGYVARKLNESSKAGAVIDILGDRIVEMTYWIAFLAMGWVPVWVPLVVMSRGILVDGLRALALAQGYTAFGETSLMQSPIGVLLVSSRFSRFSYAVCKAVAFSLIILIMTPELPEVVTNLATPVAWFSVYASVFFCVVRGLPVLIEAKGFLAQSQ